MKTSFIDQQSRVPAQGVVIRSFATSVTTRENRSILLPTHAYLVRKIEQIRLHLYESPRFTRKARKFPSKIDGAGPNPLSGDLQISLRENVALPEESGLPFDTVDSIIAACDHGRSS